MTVHSFSSRTGRLQYLALVFLISLTGVSAGPALPAGGAGPEQPSLFEWKQLDGNQINCTIASDGPFADSRRTFNSGLEWPSGTGKRMIYSAGLWAVGKHRPTGDLRTATMHFSSEYQPGPLLEIFDATTAIDSLPVQRAEDSLYRIYKVEQATADGDSSREVDPWDLWPGQLGAPYVDVDGNGVWNPGIDRPEFYGSQQLWCVLNDVSNALHEQRGMTPPLGLELQVMYWGSLGPNEVANTMFFRYVIINRSNADYDSVYLGLWDDTDMGDANDDLSGCDTLLGMSYVYNADDNDLVYGLAPPAWGFVLLQGPMVEGSPADSALAGGSWRRGYRNLPPSSFVVMTNNAVPEILEPWYGTAEYASEAFCFLQGMAGKIKHYVRRPDSSAIRFFFSGDPIAGTGDLPGNFPLGIFQPQNHRNMLNVGPFTLAEGDTQEVIAALTIAQGADRFASLAALKEQAALVRSAFYDRVTSVEGADDNPLPSGYSLSTNYPNPFNPTTVIRYRLPVAGHVRLTVHDLLGREVAVAVDGRVDAGTHEVRFDATSLASGIYLYTLKAGGFVRTRTMVVLR